jgi:hypothetical protein
MDSAVPQSDENKRGKENGEFFLHGFAISFEVF